MKVFYAGTEAVTLPALGLTLQPGVNDISEVAASHLTALGICEVVVASGDEAISTTAAPVAASPASTVPAEPEPVHEEKE